MAIVETYLPLYRKYRPQSFADVMGQEAIRQTLGNAINLGKVAHAYLFCGPRGTGKTSTARIFAKSLNCEQGPTVTPCQTCASCVGITVGNALDVIEFDAASNNKVDDARELIENCQFSPMAGRYKIYIIDEVHMLTSQAFNALLKTLEEPPANVIFIFATTEAHKVLPTIISRCQRFDFTRITRQDIIKRLSYIAEQENIQIDAQALDTIARHVRGGMRDAVGLLDQVAVIGRAQPDKVIARDDVAMFIGALEEDILIWLSRAVAERQADVLLQQIGELERRGIEPPQIVKELTSHYRHLFFVASAAQNNRQMITAEQLDLPEAYFEKLQEQVPLYALEELPQILSRLSSIERNIRNTQQPQLWLEVGLLELAYRQDIHQVQQLAERLDALEQRVGSGGAAMPAPQPARPIPTSAPRPSIKPSQPPTRPEPVISQDPLPPASSVTATEPVGTVAAEDAVAPLSEPVQPILSQPDDVPPVQNESVPVAPVVPVVPEPVTLEPAMASAVVSEAQAVYQRICQQVASATTRDLLVQQTFALSLDGVSLKIGCASEPILTIVKNPRKFIHLQKAADTVLGQSAMIELVLEKNGARPPVAAGSGGAPAYPKPDGAVKTFSAAPASRSASVSAVLEKPAVTAEVSVSSFAQKKVVDTPASSIEMARQPMESQGQPISQPAVSAAYAMNEPSSLAMMPFDDDAPPMEDDEPPLVDNFDMPMTPDKVTTLAGFKSTLPEGSVGKQMAESVTNEDMESYQLREARHYTLQLLQGRLLD